VLSYLIKIVQEQLYLATMFRAPGRGHSRSNEASSGRRRAREHVGKVDGRGHARGPPNDSRSAARPPPPKKNTPSVIARYTVPKLDARLMTLEDILYYGLCYVGFGEERQNVVNETSVKRFRVHFGPEPRTVKDLMNDLCDELPAEHPSRNYLWV
jgi:hypothetical protein